MRRLRSSNCLKKPRISQKQLAPRLDAGIDPIDARNVAAAEAAQQLTFKEAAEKFIDGQADSWKSPKQAKLWRATLAQYAYPIMPVPSDALTPSQRAAAGNAPVVIVYDEPTQIAILSAWASLTPTAQRIGSVAHAKDAGAQRSRLVQMLTALEERESASTAANALVIDAITTLRTILRDVDRGVVSPILRPPVPGNKKRPMDLIRRRAYAAAALGALIADGVAKAQAADSIAQRLQPFVHLFDTVDGKLTGDKIVRWAEEAEVYAPSSIEGRNYARLKANAVTRADADLMIVAAAGGSEELI